MNKDENDLIKIRVSAWEKGFEEGTMACLCNLKCLQCEYGYDTYCKKYDMKFQDEVVEHCGMELKLYDGSD